MTRIRQYVDENTIKDFVAQTHYNFNLGVHYKQDVHGLSVFYRSVFLKKQKKSDSDKAIC